MPDTAAVQQAFDRFIAAVNADDIDAWLAAQSGDCVWQPPDRVAVEGQEALRTYGHDVWFGLYKMNLEMKVEEVVPVSDSYAYARGSWTIGLTPKDGSEPTALAGTNAMLLRQEGGDLKFARVAFSIFE